MTTLCPPHHRHNDQRLTALASARLDTAPSKPPPAAATPTSLERAIHWPAALTVQ